MAQRAPEQRVEHLEHRVATAAQILPTLATKADLAELRSATKAESGSLAGTSSATSPSLSVRQSRLTCADPVGATPVRATRSARDTMRVEYRFRAATSKPASAALSGIDGA